MLAPLLLTLASFSPVHGVQVACTENLEGREGRARVELVVGAGAMNEQSSARGVAHMLEHLLLRPLGFDDNNGSTGWDFTNYYRDLKAREVRSAGLELIRALVAPKLNAEEFAIEQQVVVRELEDRGVGLGDRRSDPIFGDSLLARYPGASAAAVRDLELKDVQEFYDRHYVRGNVALFVRGATRCAGLSDILAKEIARLPEGDATAVPRDLQKPRGPYSLPGGGFGAGFVWFDSNLETELAYRVVAKHFEQQALKVLRQERGLTYSPQSHFERRAGGGRTWLTVSTDHQDAEVAEWYDKELSDLSGAPEPWDELKDARDAVAGLVERDTVRRSLAAIRGEQDPVKRLGTMPQPPIKALLAERHRMSTQLAERNIGSLVVLFLFGLLVLGALAMVFKSFR